MELRQTLAYLGKSTTVRTCSANKQAGVFRLVGSALRGLERISPAAAAELGFRIFFTPLGARRQPRPAELEIARGGAPIEIRWQHGRLRGHRWGDVERPVLLVHGWGGYGLQMASFAAELARRGRSVVTFDLPSHGNSGRGRTSILHFSRAIAAVARAYGPFDGLVAHSLGAGGAILALSREGVTVERLAFLGPVAHFDTTSQRFIAETGIRPETFALLQRRAESWLGTSWEDALPIHHARLQRQPLLIVHARDDDELPLEHGEQLAAVWENARLVKPSGLGHYRILRDATVVAQVADFLDA